MYTLDKEKAKKILISELQYSSAEADMYLSEFPQLNDKFANAVSQWLVDRTVIPVDVYGLSILDLMKIQNWHFLMAVQHLSPLLDTTIPEEKRLQIVQILQKPFQQK